MTAAIRRGNEDQSSCNLSTVISLHSNCNLWMSSALVLIEIASSENFTCIICHLFSIIYRSGDWGGLLDTLIWRSSTHFLVSADEWIGTLSWTKNSPLQGKTSPIHEEDHIGRFGNIYFFKLMLPSTGSRIPTPKIVIAPQIITLNSHCVRPSGIK